MQVKQLIWPLVVAAWSVSAHAASVLSASDEKALLNAIDNICGDTWCEGDSNWSFDALKCDDVKGCKLALTMKPYDLNPYEPNGTRPLSCDLSQFKTRQSLVKTTSLGLEYTDELYDAVSSCINDKLLPKYGPIYIQKDESCRSLFPESPASSSLSLVNSFKRSSADAATQVVSKIVDSAAAVAPDLCVDDAEFHYKDQTACRTTKGTGEICTLPTSKGAFVVARDKANGSQVIYISNQAQDVTPKLKFLDGAAIDATIPQVALCKTSLLQKSSLQDDALTLGSELGVASQTHSVSVAANADSDDIRLRALADIHALVKAHAAADANNCQYQIQKFDVKSVNCVKQKGTTLCSVAEPNGGYFHVVFDQSGASQVVYVP